ncbi:peptidylprolyl isomerase [Luminiphilus sp.]|nr:peptidylprolyl isomerase [Luminiphilus sp.]
MLYLELLATDSDRAIGDLSGQRVSQAVIELFALKTLDADAAGTGLYSPALEAWLPDYLLAMERVTRFINVSVVKAMDETNWEAEAREYYAGNGEQFQVGESLSIRTLLIRTSTRSLEEALDIANSLLTDRLPEQTFKSLAEEYSEDEVGRLSGGLMENVTRGETVLPFEEAAFSLTQPGQLSPPVVSEFGVHLIKLLSRSPSRKKSFEEVSLDIVAYLKRIRKDEYKTAIQSEARNREPPGYRINETAIDALMKDLGHSKLGGDMFLMQD